MISGIYFPFQYLYPSKQNTPGRINTFLFDTQLAIHYKQREINLFEGGVYNNRQPVSIRKWPFFR
jgi:hypothetical protein